MRKVSLSGWRGLCGDGLPGARVGGPERRTADREGGREGGRPTGNAWAETGPLGLTSHTALMAFTGWDT